MSFPVKVPVTLPVVMSMMVQVYVLPWYVSTTTLPTLMFFAPLPHVFVIS